MRMICSLPDNRAGIRVDENGTSKSPFAFRRIAVGQLPLPSPGALTFSRKCIAKTAAPL